MLSGTTPPPPPPPLCNLLGNRTRAWHGRLQGWAGAEKGLRKRKERAQQQQDKRRLSAAGNKGFLATIPGLGDINKGLSTEQKGSAEATLGKQEPGGLGKRGKGSAATGQ